MTRTGTAETVTTGSLNGADEMRKVIQLLVAATAASVALAPSPAWAGNPHFVEVDATRVDDSLVVSFKEAGLGNEPQVEIEVTATAACVNPGANKPKAANKQTVSAEGTFPVQNGKAEGTLTLSPVFQPSCSPPMTVEFSNVTISDLTSGISRSIPGIF
jgi:hypothetical protein